MSSTPRTVLFDIDGTLIDSNYLHIDAWSRAFAAVERPIAAWRIHRGIGMDGDLLVEELLGADAAELGGRASDIHSRLYRDMSARLRPLRGARELVRHLARDGRRVVLATSAPQDELELLLPVLDLGDSVDVVTSSADADIAKPAPDLLQVALERADTAPGDAVMIGDSVWDMRAARRAGVRGIGVLTGGVGAAELQEAGADAVFRDAADLLERIAESPLA